MGGEEVLYHDVSPRSSTTPAVASGAAEEEPPTKKKTSFFAKLTIASVVIMAIVLSVVLTRDGATDAFKRNDKAEKSGNEVVEAPSYYPTYWPTYMPTYMPTDGGGDDKDKDKDKDKEEGSKDGGDIADIEEDNNSLPVDFAGVEDVLTANVEEEVLEEVTPVEEEEVIEEETTTTTTTTAEATTPAATTTTTTTTTEATTTTTPEPHPVCGANVTYKVFKLQYTPSSPDATYTFSARDAPYTIYSSTPPDLPLNEMYEEKVCVPAGEYEFSMSGGACVDGYYRGEMILFSCAEGSIVINVVEKGD